MVLVILIDIALLLLVGVPIFLALRSWSQWVGRLSDRLWPFEKPRRFGLRSWAARSFMLDAPVNEVLRRIDELQEMQWLPSAMRSPAGRGAFMSGIGALGALVGAQKVSTGIEIEWLDRHTAEVRARQHADWPATPEDDARLPFRQRQRLAEHVMLHVEPGPSNRTRVSYELEVPCWIYIMSAAVVLAMGWIAWGLWVWQNSPYSTEILRRLAVNPDFAMRNTAVFWIPLSWLATRTTQVFRLQSISLLDNIISTLGRMVHRDE